MMDVAAKIQETVGAIERFTEPNADIAIILGTGLGGLTDALSGKVGIPYEKLPNFPEATVRSHKGELVFGRIGRKRVAAMQGRFHYYEGHALKDITYPVRVARALGAEILMVSNAAGGMNLSYNLGDLMLITDHINLMGVNPLIGPNDDKLGPRFPDMCEPYDNKLVELAERLAKALKIRVQKGVYVGVTGPNLETRAEYRFLRMIGADVVGMSTIPEVLAGVHAGFRIFGISCITDRCDPDNLEPADINKIIKVAGEAEPKMAKLITEMIKSL